MGSSDLIIEVTLGANPRFLRAEVPASSSMIVQRLLNFSYVTFELFSSLFHRPFESPLSTYLTELNVSANMPRDSQPPIDSFPARLFL